MIMMMMMIVVTVVVHFFVIGPNVVVEWLTLTLPIREVPGSYLSPDTGYPDLVLVVFISPFRQMLR
jgi:hypothetical protein